MAGPPQMNMREQTRRATCTRFADIVPALDGAQRAPAVVFERSAPSLREAASRSGGGFSSRHRLLLPRPFRVLVQGSVILQESSRVFQVDGMQRIEVARVGAVPPNFSDAQFRNENT